MKTLHYFSVLCILLGVFFISSPAQNKQVDKSFFINADYYRFWKNDSTAYLEVSSAVYPGVTKIKKDSSGLHGKIEMTIIILNESTNVVAFSDRFNIPLHFTDSISLRKTNFMVNNRTYSLECGTYRITVIGKDNYDHSHSDSALFVIDILRKPASAVLSDIELCSNISVSSDKNNSFYKNSYIVIPQPSCVFGSTTSPILFTYTECYNIDAGRHYTVISQIVDMKGNVKKNRTYQRRFTASNAIDITSLNIASLLSGKYNLVLTLSDSLGRELARSQRTIYLHNPQIQQSHVAIAEEIRQEISGMTIEQLEEEFQTAKYLAQSEEIKIYEKLTTVDVYRVFMEKFWSRVETEEQNKTNLTRTDYIQKVKLVNQRYGGQSKEGWRTDRGRVCLIYGEPDEIQRFPNSNNSRPYEIWSYHQLEGGAEFIFVDLTGFNEYILVHSTKRGEIYDGSWEKLLQREGSSITPGHKLD